MRKFLNKKNKNGKVFAKTKKIFKKRINVKLSKIYFTILYLNIF